MADGASQEPNNYNVALTRSTTGRVRRQADEPTPTILTTGPDPATHEIIPQMFFEFRGAYLFLFLF